ncbi:MAG: hypothetical protein F9K30_22880 [Dechloromonas sp.]|nr:MAG: hypothetical protein F9K30_22880 [Dechloromonas sp.]
MLFAPNFSIGVALLLELAARAGALFAQHPQFGAALVETHHAAKKDAPSGTAIAIHDALVPPLGRGVPMTSVRVGAVPGTHTIVFDGPFEQVTLTHEARDRRVFADGAVRDSDYARDHRQAEFSRSLADARDSEMFDASLGFGWRLPLGGLGSLTPLVGVAHHESTYRSSNGRQVVSDAANAALLGIAWNMPLGPFDGLHSRYRPRWQGVWLGIDGEFKATERLTLRAGIKRHWFDFKADANWNLRGDLAHPLSFRQRDDGRGWEAEAGAAIRLAGSHRLTLETNRRAMKTARGENTTFHYNGARSTIDLGETELASWSARLGYRYDF